METSKPHFHPSTFSSTNSFIMPRPPKRARLSESITEMEIPSQDDKHTLFATWAKERGVEIDSVAPKQLPGRGLGLMTTAAIEAGTRILFVPEKAMFKPDAAFVKRSGRQHHGEIHALRLSTRYMGSDVADEGRLRRQYAAFVARGVASAPPAACYRAL
jgi:hypothetical protein